MGILSVFLIVLAALFTLNTTRMGKKVYQFVPMIVFAYFLPTLLSNVGLIPLKSDLYTFIKSWILPVSLILLTLSVDLKAILGLGRNALWLFLLSTITVVIGGPLALFLTQAWLPVEMGDQLWKGLAALAGSWIGGGANFVAIGQSVGASDTTMASMVIVDVFVAEVWTVILFYFAGREVDMDRKIGADRKSIDTLRKKVESFRKKVLRPTTAADLFLLMALSVGGTFLAKSLASVLPDVGDIIRNFTWVVIIVTSIGLGLSFTRFRKLEGVGASSFGTFFIFLLVAVIGAKAQFSEVMKVPSLILIGVVWITIHILVLMIARRILKAPIFFVAVGSKANIGGAASAPIVAGAFHPSLAPVGVLLAIGGYVLGTYAALISAFLLEKTYFLIS